MTEPVPSASGVKLIERSWLDAEATQTLIAALDAAGIAFRFVGGAVRDGLLGRPVADVDVATQARPDLVMKALETAGLKAIPTGIAHGTVTAVVDRRHFEITTLRRDVETDGRHAVVAFTDDWREDAARRDFTMNALYADREGTITDFFGGAADLRAGRVRFIGDPEQRIAEDALRILRFFRFHAWYGRGATDSGGLAACTRLAGMIDRLSGERLQVEIFKTLRAPDPSPVWQAMIEAGVMAHTTPAATRVDALSRMVALEDELGQPADPMRRLAALIGPLSTESADTLKRRLKLSNRNESHLRSLDTLEGRMPLISSHTFGQALYGSQADWVRDAAMLAHVRYGKPEITALAALSRFIAGWVQPKFPLSGADLQSVGIVPGPDLGRLLTDLERWWVAADFKPDRAACLARLKQT